jgi:hypothetical protein
VLLHVGKVIMGRGKSWTPFEREGLAISWLKASKDPRTGAYRDSADFWKPVVRAFHERDPRGTLGYCTRSVKACKNIFLGDISPDVQKFAAVLRRIIASEPTGVTNENIVSMSIAVYTGLTARMEYKYCNLPHTEWATRKLGRCSRLSRNGRRPE